MGRARWTRAHTYTYTCPPPIACVVRQVHEASNELEHSGRHLSASASVSSSSRPPQAAETSSDGDLATRAAGLSVHGPVSALATAWREETRLGEGTAGGGSPDELTVAEIAERAALAQARARHARTGTPPHPLMLNALPAAAEGSPSTPSVAAGRDDVPTSLPTSVSGVLPSTSSAVPGDEGASLALGKSALDMLSVKNPAGGGAKKRTSLSARVAAKKATSEHTYHVLIVDDSAMSVSSDSLRSI